MRFNFLKLLDRMLLHFFPAALRDNVVSDDVTITSSLRSGVIILGINFLCS